MTEKEIEELKKIILDVVYDNGHYICNLTVVEHLQEEIVKAIDKYKKRTDR